MAPEFSKPIHHLPLIPATVKNIASTSRFTRFQSAARLLLTRQNRSSVLAVKEFSPLR